MSERVKTEERFWEERYSTGGESGKGSVGGYRKWKWKVIEKYVKVNDKTVLDVGCGDLQFMKGKKFKTYLGIDISKTIIQKNRAMRRDWSFLVMDAASDNAHKQQYDVVFCMDVLFHIMDDSRFAQLLKNLNGWTGSWLFVVGWTRNPLTYLHDSYQYYRNLKNWLQYLPDLALVGEYQKKGDPYNTLYVFWSGLNE